MTAAWQPDEASSSVLRTLPGPRGRPLVVGIVNNMPEAAFEATADQFGALLEHAASDGFDLSLRFFAPPGREPVGAVTSAASRRHEPAQALWISELDGLIVTGAEPQASHIAGEPSLPFLARLVDWAEARALPAIWSCLAAHAAAYHLDGIERTRREAKLSGVFECIKVGQHALLDNSPTSWPVPHSRLNELPEADLAARGYRILTRAPDVGADTFIKQTGTLHLFLNGHPEYEKGTLLAEYKRDVRRFLLGQRDSYPEIPQGYFTAEAALELAAFRRQALDARMPALMSDFPSAVPAAMFWRDAAVGLFRNWLAGIACRTADRDTGIHVAAISRPAAASSQNPRSRYAMPRRVLSGKRTL